MRWPLRVVAAIALLAGGFTPCACKNASKPAPSPAPTRIADAAPAAEPPAPIPQVTPNAFFRRGTPTFVFGTRGDDTADHRIAVQVGLIRGLALPAAPAVADHSIDPDKGPAAWPANPVLYGSADDNTILSALAPTLPYQVNSRRIVIGGQVFEGDGYRLIAVTPASDKHPAFLLYAGTGAGGIAEINASLKLTAPIIIADRFGVLAYGTWARESGKLVAKLGPKQRRIEYRTVERQLRAANGKHTATVRFGIPKMLAPRADEPALVDGCMRGLSHVVRKLGVSDPEDVWVYLYPDRRSKAQLTGNGGAGHAIPSSRTLHMLATSPAAAEKLVTHEATHVLGYYGYGPAGTALMGEGMAVWVAGGYAGKSLGQWAKQTNLIPLTQLIGKTWQRFPEPAKYPLAGLLFGVAVKQVGLAKVRKHLLGATVYTWDAELDAAGTSTAQLEQGLRARLGVK